MKWLCRLGLHRYRFGESLWMLHRRAPAYTRVCKCCGKEIAV